MSPAGKAILAACMFALGIAASVVLGRVAPSAPSRLPPAADAAPSRIICMSPAVTEIAFALGAGERIVGVSQHAVYPPEARNRPQCGGFFNPNWEAILSLRPDLIVTQGRAEVLGEFARKNGIALVSLELTDLAAIVAETRRLGQVLGLPKEAMAVCTDLTDRLARVRSRSAGLLPVSAVVVTAREPGALQGIYVAGRSGFLDDVLRIAGGENVFGDLASGYAPVSKEAILDRGPAVVIELHGEGGDADALTRSVRRVWQGLAPLPAVRDNRVYAIESTYAMVPGPRVVLLAERLFELLHGEAR